MFRILAVLPVALSIALSLHATPTVSPELPLTPLDSVPAIGNQYVPAIATNGQEGFAVWVDYRGQDQLGELLGSRVAADGTLLDPHGIIIDYDVDENPEIVWTGSEFLIVVARWDWSERTFLPTWAHRIRPDGSRVGEPVFVGDIASRKLFSNGSEAVITGTAPGTGRFFAYLHPDGRIRQSVSLGSLEGVTAVADGSDWVVFKAVRSCDIQGNCGDYIHQLRIRDGRIAEDKRLDAPLASFAPFRITAATDGNGRFFVVWSDVTFSRADPKVYKYSGGLRYIVTNRDANVLHPPRTVEQITANIPSDQKYSLAPIGEPEVIWYHDRFIAVWPWFDANGRTEIHAVSVSSDGAQIEREPVVLDSTVSEASNSYKRPVLAATSARLHLLWSERTLFYGVNQSDIVGRSGVSLADVAAQTFAAANLLRSASRQSGVQVAAGDDAMFVLFSSTADDISKTLQGRLLYYNGAESPVITISEGTELSPLSTSAVAYAQGVWLVAWQESLYRLERGTGRREFFAIRVLARRYDRRGNPLEEDPILLAEEVYSNLGSSYTSAVSIATSGSQFLVTWPGVTGGSVTTYRKIRAMRIGVDGTLIDAEPKQISSAGTPRRGAPQAVWTGTDYLLLWQEDATPDNVSPVPLVPVTARSTRMSTAGVVSGAFPELISSPSTYDIRRSSFVAATNGTELLITWSESFQNSRGCVYAQRFTFDGAPLSAKLAVTCGNGHDSVPVRPWPLWDGAKFRIVYSHADAVWAHTLDGAAPVKLFESTGELFASRPVVTPVGIIFPYLRKDSAYGTIDRVFRRMVSFNPPRRRAVR